ncbi:hypothetical protein ILYODFUR_030884 [Ilyodon furcidens]|uniref:Secreted protein n=1 Tax=Ilyodon furcidens TaxID=33524 RepID=A0ABV0UBU7_9TELE
MKVFMICRCLSLVLGFSSDPGALVHSFRYSFLPVYNAFCVPHLKVVPLVDRFLQLLSAHSCFGPHSLPQSAHQSMLYIHLSVRFVHAKPSLFIPASVTSCLL